MAGFQILDVLGLVGFLAHCSMAWYPPSDDDLLVGDNMTRLDALLAIGISSLEQMQRAQDDTWQGASTDSDDEIDDSVFPIIPCIPIWRTCKVMFILRAETANS